MLPEVGRLSPSIISSVVVLPAPLGPTTPKVSPRWTEKEMSSTAVRLPYLFVRFRTSMLAGIGVSQRGSREAWGGYEGARIGSLAVEVKGIALPR